MAAAKPFPVDRTKQPTTSPRAPRTPRAPGNDFDGLPTVGQIFIPAAQDYFCTASVVSSPGHNIVLTAGHCLDDEDAGKPLAFVPQYTKNKPQPYGIFPLLSWSPRHNKIWIDARYYSRGHQHGAPYDAAFLKVGANTNGKQVEDAVGGNRLKTDAGYEHNNVHLIGYPGGHPRPKTCTAPTTKYTSTDPNIPGSYLRIACDGYSPGVSGGPFLANFDEKTKTGDVIGDIGGYKTGGPTDDISYSSYFGADIKNLYDQAVADHRPETSVLGTAATWRHARLLASGNYTGHGDGTMDMIVVWTDGEVTLYTGDGNATFKAERQLLSPNSTWKHAKAITGGDYAGSNLSDLLVTWSDGEVSLYPDVDLRGFHQEIQLAKPESIWKKAEQIAGGNFGTNGYTTDLIVRWADGELTNYTKVSSQGFGTEHQLLKPNDLWKKATLTTAGDFSGNDYWDLLVRWSDGEVSQYQDTNAAGLGKEIQMAAPHTIWEHDMAMTAGSFNHNGHPDDLIVRWSDGEVTDYTDTNTKFGTEHQLVAPDGHSIASDSAESADDQGTTDNTDSADTPITNPTDNSDTDSDSDPASDATGTSSIE